MSNQQEEQTTTNQLTIVFDDDSTLIAPVIILEYSKVIKNMVDGTIIQKKKSLLLFSRS